jgi:tetratricopeptide (TPR) repeat protein
MAEVYLAYHPALQREVAIKVMLAHLSQDASFVLRFEREAQAVARLRHAHIVQVYDFGLRRGQPYMVMEYVSGGSLNQRLAHGPLALPEALRILRGLAAAVDYAHGEGMVHRDIKPANILFTDRDEPVLTDFGIVRILEGTAHTATGAILGTPAYMSPEQARGETAGPAADLYALGVVLYHMVTGRLPFTADSPTGVLMRHITDPPPPPRPLRPELSPAAETVMLKALAKDPADRYANVVALADAFAFALGFAAPASVTATPESATVVTPLEAATPAAAALVDAPVPKLPVIPPPAPPPSGSPFAVWWEAIRLTRGLLGTVKPADAPGAPTRRGRLAAAVGVAASLLAALEYIFRLLDLFSRNRQLSPLSTLLPYLVGGLLVVGLVVAGYGFFRPASQVQRRRSALAFGLVALVGVGWAGLSWSERNRPVQGELILVANINASGGSQKAIDPARDIYSGVRDQIAALGLADVEVQRVFEDYADADAARAAGEARQAMLLIWGWYDDLGVRPHFEILRLPPEYSAAFLRVNNPRSFDFFIEEGSREVSYMATVVLGLARYVAADYTQALSLFDSAIANAPAGEEGFGKEIAHFYKANALLYSETGGSAPVVENLRQAIAAQPQLYSAHFNLALAYTRYCEPARTLDLALQEAQEAVKLKPSESDSHWLLGKVFFERDEWALAVQALEQAVRLAPDDADLHLELARAYEKSGATGQAQSEREQALALRQVAPTPTAQDAAEAHAGLGTAHFDLEQYDQAIAAYRQAVEAAPDESYYHRVLGNALFWAGQEEEALAEYERAVQLAPNDSLARGVAGSLYQKLGRTDDAIAEYEAIVRYDPCDADTYFFLASLYDQAGRADDAEAAFRRVVAIEPGNIVAWRALGLAAESRDDYAAAATIYDQAIKSATPNADDAALRNGLANSYYFLGEYDKAAAEYEATVRLAPDEAMYQAGLGDVYAKLERPDDAIAAYQQAITLNPDESRYHLSLGLVYEVQGRWDEAAAAYEAALALDDPLAPAALGAVYDRLNRPADAIRAYEAALTESATPEIQSALGWDYLQVCRAADAQSAFEAALEVQPNPSTALGLAAAAEAQGKAADAEAAYNSAVAAAPGNGYILWARGLFYDRQGRTTEAAAAFDSVPEAQPARSLALASRAYLYGEAGQLDQAQTTYEDALSGWPDNVPALAGLGDLALLRGEPDAALAAYQTALDHYEVFTATLPDTSQLYLVSLHLGQGLAHERAGRGEAAQSAFTQARELAEDAVARRPDDSQARYGLALALLAAGDLDEAEAEIEKAIGCDQSLSEAWERAQARLARLRAQR